MQAIKFLSSLSNPLTWPRRRSMAVPMKNKIHIMKVRVSRRMIEDLRTLGITPGPSLDALVARLFKKPASR